MQLPSLRRLTLCLVLGASVLPTVPAHAQLGMQAGFVEAFQPDFLHRDMDLFRQYLLLEEWQQPIVESLLKDYLADFKIGTDGLRDTMKNMKDQIIAAGDQGAIGVIMGPIDRWIEEKARLKGRFVDNLRSQLSEEQMNHWVDLERAMRREKELPRGELSGEAIDLSLISRTVDVPPEVLASAKEQVTAYEMGLDEALAARAKQVAASQPIIKEAMIRQDYQAGLAQLELIVAKRIAVRDFQERSIDLLAAAYGEKFGETFKQAALAAAYPMVYRPSPLVPFFEAARALPGLSAEQITQLNELEKSYSASYADYQSRLAAVLRVEEPKKQTAETRRRMTQGQASATKPNNDAYTGLYAERDILNERTREEIARILGPELAKQLPGAEKREAADVHAPPPPKDGSGIPSLTPGTSEGPGSGKPPQNRRERLPMTRPGTGGERPGESPSRAE